MVSNISLRSSFGSAIRPDLVGTPLMGASLLQADQMAGHTPCDLQMADSSGS